MSRRKLERDYGVKFFRAGTEVWAKNPTRDMTRGEERKMLADHLLKARVKKLRPLFGDMFKPASGFDLRKLDEWTPAMKSRVTKYYHVMAPLIARPHTTRRYKDPAHLREAVAYTQQEKWLPGQRAAVFDIARDEKLQVKFTRQGRIKVQRGGVLVRKAYFDMALFLEDQAAAVDEAMAELEGATRFKLIMGPHESRGYFKSRNAVLAGISFYRGQYSEDEEDAEDEHSHYFGNWLFGIIGYFGQRKEIDQFIDVTEEQRSTEVKARVRGRVERKNQWRRQVAEESKRRGTTPRRKKKRARK